MIGSPAGHWLGTNAHTRTASSVGATLLVTHSALSFRRDPIMRRDGKEWGSWRASAGRLFSLNPRLHNDGRSESLCESTANSYTQFLSLGRASGTTSSKRACLPKMWITPGQIAVMYGASP
jgi:hypothetical protein